jgi:hypothetical protein
MFTLRDGFPEITNGIDFSPLVRRCLDAATDELATDFRGVFCRETVARCVEDSAGRCCSCASTTPGAARSLRR